jgi:uncharacterized membrane protein YhaH (DUF805 family)
MLVNWFVATVVAIAGDIVFDGEILTGVYLLAILVPFLAVTFRRLHDTGRSGVWILLCFVPFGAIFLIIFLATGSDRDTNEYGPDPRLTPVR